MAVVNRLGATGGENPSGSGLRRVEKTGVYRNEAGHAVQFQEGSDVPQYVLDTYKFDKAGTDEAVKALDNTEVNFRGVIDAPQDDFLLERAEQRPQNRSDTPAANKSDANLAADAAKK